MATYTIELRRVCEIYGRDEVESWFKDYDINEFLLPEQIEVLNKVPNIWSKDRLATKIVDHYFMREIGFETPALFRHYAKVTMQEIMEEKLPLIYTTALSYDPLVNVDFTETFKRKANENAENNLKSNNNGSSTSSSSNSSNGLNVNSDTPQGQLNKDEILNGKYASNTNASETQTSINDKTNTENNTSSSSNGTTSSEEEYTKHFKGNQGISATYQAMIKQFRQNIIAVDKDIIHELNTLFMGIY